MSVGNRVYLKKPMAAQELLNGFEHTPCANVADTMGRLASMHPRIQLLSKPEKAITAGRAVTIKCRAGDNLMLHKALNMIEPGDVVVMDTDGVVIVPLRDAEEILEAAIAYHEQDAAKLVAAANGTSKRDWVEKTLEKIGTEIIDDYYM